MPPATRHGNLVCVRPCPARRLAGFVPKEFLCAHAWIITGKNHSTSWRLSPRPEPVVEPMSIDEAYLDMSAICQAENADASLLKAFPLAQQLKQRIISERQLTATIGIASNKLLAKIASDHKKPDGLTMITEQEKVSFLRPLPVRALYGVGKVTEQTLNRVGIVKIGDLQDYAGDLRALVGSFGPKLKQFAFGEDDRPLEIGDEIKSISGEETFLKDTEDRKILRACLKEQAADISVATQAPATGSAHRSGESSLQRFYHAHAPDFGRGAAYRGCGYLPAGMFFAGPGKVGVTSVAVVGAWRKQFARAERTAIGTALRHVFSWF